MSDPDVEKTIKIVQFSGKQEDWRKWSRKFLARATMKKYKGVLLGTTIVPAESDVLDLRTNEGKAAKAARDANEIGYNELLLCSDDDVVFATVDSACTADLPSGSARLAWQNLEAKFEPKTSASKVELRRQFTTTILEDESVHPDSWLASLEKIRQQLAGMNSPISDNDMILHILCNLPRAYETLSEQLERRVDHQQNPLTLDELREELRLKYQRLTRYNQKEDATALVANFKKGFKGTCRLCGKYGHKATDCWHNKSNNQSQATTNPTQDKIQNNQNENKNKKECKYCKKSGHTVDECWKLKFKKEKDEKNKNEDKKQKIDNDKKEKKEENDVVMIMTQVDENIALQCADIKKKYQTYELWIGDTGATAHMSNSPDGFENIVYIESKIKMGNKATLISPFYGDKKVSIIQGQQKIQIVLRNCKFVPDLFVNLLSLTQAIKMGFNMTNDGLKIKLSNKKFQMILDQTIKNNDGVLIGVFMEPILPEIHLSMSNNKVSTIDELHDIFGHPSEYILRMTIKKYNLKGDGKLNDCKACAIAKAKAKNIGKINENKTTTPGERLYLDISSVNKPSYGGSKYWLLIVDEASRFKWSYFLKSKDELKIKMIELIEWMTSQDKKIKFLRCDNAGENIALQQQCKKLNLQIIFEYTAPNTPQQNGVVERAFATLYGRIRAMLLNTKNLPEEIKTGLWAECASTATFLSNILVDQENTSPYEKFFNSSPKFPIDMYPFGTTCIVTNRSHIKSKLQDRGEECIFVGYASDHASDVYRFFKKSTRKIILSRDVKWLLNENKKDEIKLIKEHETGREYENDKKENTNLDTAENKKYRNAMKKLNTFYNPTIDGLMNYHFMSAVESDYSEPQNFGEAWNNENDIDKQNWREAIKKEFLSMKEKQVWKIVDLNDVPTNRRLLGTKWVFKKKFRSIQGKIGCT
jgi:hypothetical protein